MSIDWSKYGTVGGGGRAINWQQHGTAPLIKSDEPSGGGGGFWGSIGGFLGGHGPLGGVEKVVGNTVGQGWDVIHGAPTAIAHLPGMAWHDVTSPNRVSLIDLLQNPSRGIHNIGKELHDPKGFVGATYLPIETDVKHARRGDWHYFQQHPLNLVLDAATIASLGGGGALRLARAGVAGERLGTLARSERALVSESGYAEPLRASKTLQGRARQQIWDTFSANHPDLAVVGRNVRLARIANNRARSLALRGRLPFRDFQRLTQPLEPDEKFAFHIAHAGVPLDDRIAYYKTIIDSGRGSKALRNYVKDMERPGVRAALTNPRPEFTQALWGGHELEAQAGQNLVESGQLAPESRAERALLERRVIEGRAEYAYPAKERILGHDPYEVDRAAMKKETRTAERDLRRAQRRVTQLQERVRIRQTDRARKALAEAKTVLADAKQRRDFLAEGERNVPPPIKGQTIQTEGEWHGPTAADFGEDNPIHPDFPPPSRFPHIAKSGGLPRGTTAPGTEGMLGKAPVLNQLRHNAAALLQQALFHTDPERVLGTDFLSTMRNRLIVDMQKGMLDPISLAPEARFVETGFKREGEYWYRPSYDRKRTTPISPETRLMEAKHQDRAPIREREQQASLKQAAKRVVSDDPHDLGLPADLDLRDQRTLDELNRLGIRRVPKAFGKQFSQEFAGTHAAVRYFVDRPLDVWRAITLNFRPAWAVNNFVGNAVMGLAATGPAGAAAYLRVLLTTERGEDKMRSLWGWTFKHPTIRRKYGHVFREVAPELHSAGFFGAETRQTHGGVYEGRYANFVANPAVKALGFAPKQVGRGVMKVGRGITKLEVLLAEDTSREAAFLASRGADIAKIRALAKKAEGVNLSYADAIRQLDQKSVEAGVRDVADWLGDFNDLSHFERSVVRRFIPFYSWYKVITKVSAKYAARYPARVELLRNIEQAQDTKGDPPLPSWLSGAYLVGKPKGDVQSLLSTQGLNPYETLPQVAEGGPVGLFNPVVGSAFIGGTGRNPTFGNIQDYYGLGATSRGGWGGFAERFGGSLVSGLAPTRLYQQTTEPYQGKLYAPKTYHAGPVPVSDWWLQYLGLPLRHVRLQEAKRERGL